MSVCSVVCIHTLNRRSFVAKLPHRAPTLSCHFVGDSLPCTHRRLLGAFSILFDLTPAIDQRTLLTGPDDSTIYKPLATVDISRLRSNSYPFTLETSNSNAYTEPGTVRERGGGAHSHRGGQGLRLLPCAQPPAHLEGAASVAL